VVSIIMAELYGALRLAGVSDEQEYESPSEAVNVAVEIKQTVATTTSAFESSALLINSRDPASPADGMLGTVDYESRMFLETCGLALDNWDELGGKVVQHAIVEDAVLHARSLCEIFLGSGKEDTISLKRLFPDFDQNKEKYDTLRKLRTALDREYCHENGRACSYEDLFNTRVLHPTDLRGNRGEYEEPLRRLRPKLLDIIREIGSLVRSDGSWPESF
jgi:hypothetical protein